MNRLFHCLAGIVLTATALAAAGLQSGAGKDKRPPRLKELPPPAARAVDFVKEVRPILSAQCLECHGPKKQKGDLRLDSRQAVLKGGENGSPVVVGNSAASDMVKRMAGMVKDDDDIMPPKGDGLSAEQIGILRAWIDQGLKWE